MHIGSLQHSVNRSGQHKIAVMNDVTVIRAFEVKERFMTTRMFKFCRITFNEGAIAVYLWKL